MLNARNALGSGRTGERDVGQHPARSGYSRRSPERSVKTDLSHSLPMV